MAGAACLVGARSWLGRSRSPQRTSVGLARLCKTLFESRRTRQDRAGHRSGLPVTSAYPPAVSSILRCVSRHRPSGASRTRWRRPGLPRHTADSRGSTVRIIGHATGSGHALQISLVFGDLRLQSLGKISVCVSEFSSIKIASLLYLRVFSLLQCLGGGCKFVILSDSLTIHISIGCFTIRSKLSCIRSFFEGKLGSLLNAKTPSAT